MKINKDAIKLKPQMVYGVPTPPKPPVKPDDSTLTGKINNTQTPDEDVALEKNGDLEFEEITPMTGNANTQMVYGVPTPDESVTEILENELFDEDQNKIGNEAVGDEPETEETAVTKNDEVLFDEITPFTGTATTQMVYGVPTPDDAVPAGPTCVIPPAPGIDGPKRPGDIGGPNIIPRHTITDETEETAVTKNDKVLFDEITPFTGTATTQMVYGVPTPDDAVPAGPTCVIPPAPGIDGPKRPGDIGGPNIIPRPTITDETEGLDQKVNNNTVTTEDLFMANYDRELASVNIENVAQQMQLEPEKVAEEMMNIQRQYELTPEQALLVLRSKHFDGSDNLIQNILERAHNDNTAVMKEYSEKYNLDQNNARLLFRAENGLEPALTKYAQLSNISLVDAVRRGQNQQTVRTDELNDISQGVQETASSDKKAELPKTFDEYAEIYAERTGKSVEDAIKDLEQQKERYKQRLSLGFRGAHIDEWNDSSLEQYIITQAEANFNKMQMMSELSNRAAAADTATNVQSLFSSATTIAPENYSEALQSLQEQEAALDLQKETLNQELKALEEARNQALNNRPLWVFEED